MTTLNVLIADRSPAYRLGIQIALQSADLICACREVEAWSEVQAALVGVENTDLLVLGACLPELGHFRQIEMLLASHTGLPVLILADRGSADFVRRAHLSGIRGVVLKSSSLDKLGDALISVLGGRFWYPEKDERHWCETPGREYLVKRLTLLSEKEKRVLEHLKSGLKNKQIALHMSLTESAIKRHLTSIYRKLNVANRTHLVMTILQMD